MWSGAYGSRRIAQERRAARAAQEDRRLPRHLQHCAKPEMRRTLRRRWSPEIARHQAVTYRQVQTGLQLASRQHIHSLRGTGPAVSGLLVVRPLSARSKRRPPKVVPPAVSWPTAGPFPPDWNGSLVSQLLSAPADRPGILCHEVRPANRVSARNTRQENRRRP